VFHRNDRVLHELRNLVVRHHDSPLESEGPDNLAVVRINVGNEAGVVVFERIDLREIAVIDKQNPRGSTNRNRKTKQEYKNEGTQVASQLRSHGALIITGGRRSRGIR